MRIELSTRIEAPPAVVFRFLTQLDHLRFISSEKRLEWCPQVGVVLHRGREAEVRVSAGGRAITLHFTVTRLESDHLVQSEFHTWPLRGAVQRHEIEPLDEGRATQLKDLSTWSPPWFLRAIVDRHGSEQIELFSHRHEAAKRVIEAVFAARGDDAFKEGIFDDAASVGIKPIVIPL